MKATVEDISSVKKVLRITVPEGDVVKEVNVAYKTLKKTAKVKGFRPGKAPRNVLERIYKNDVYADVSSKLIQTHLIEALDETKLNVIGRPAVEPGELDPKGEYTFSATVDIRPEIADIEYKNLTLKKSKYSVSDDEIDTQLKMLQRNLATSEPIAEDRPVANQDLVLLDYQGFRDGKPFDEVGPTENFSMKVGDARIDKAFDESLIGMVANETKTIAVTFPVDHANKKMAGQLVEFKVTLKEIRKEILPEIDDEMAKKVGKFENLAELKQKITDNLDQGYKKRTEQELNEQIFSSLIEKSDFELPDTMVDFELQNIIRDATQHFEMNNVKMEDLGLTPEKLSEQYRETAEKQVRRHLILDKIIKQEALEVDDEALEKGFKEMAEAINQPVEGIKGYYKQQKELLDSFKHTLLEKQAINLIIDESTIEEVEPQKTEATEE